MAQIKTILIMRNDLSANWLAHSDYVLKRGEFGVEFTEDGLAKLKIGDGTTTWAALPYFGGSETHVYEAIPTGTETHEQAIARVVGETKLNSGDVAIVKVSIDGENYQHTAYVYTGTAWKAMDGNYDARNVYFSKDLLTTSAVGVVELENGQATIAAKGKNLEDVWQSIFVAEQNPTTTDPNVTVTLNEAKGYEVGTSVTPSWSASFDDGNYTYGPNPTGAVITSWEISDTAGNEASTATGSFPAVTVVDTTSYKVTAKGNYSAGATPLTNTGNEYEAGKIAAGSDSATSSAIYGYRNTFYGTKDTKATVDSAAIRSLTGKSNKALANGSTFNITIPVGALRVIFAYPATLRDVTSVNDVNGMNALITDSFTKTTLNVEGANGATAISYKVYTKDFADPIETANTFAVKI